MVNFRCRATHTEVPLGSLRALPSADEGSIGHDSVDVGPCRLMEHVSVTGMHSGANNSNFCRLVCPSFQAVMQETFANVACIMPTGPYEPNCRNSIYWS